MFPFLLPECSNLTGASHATDNKASLSSTAKFRCQADHVKKRIRTDSPRKRADRAINRCFGASGRSHRQARDTGAPLAPKAAACNSRGKRHAIYFPPSYCAGASVPDGASDEPLLVLRFARVLCFLCFFRAGVVVLVSDPEGPTAPEICGVAEEPDCVPY